MMKKTILSILLVITFIGCTNKNESLSIKNKKSIEQNQIKQQKKERQWNEGVIESYVPKNDKEKQLIKQTDNYIKAMQCGDRSTIYSHMYDKSNISDSLDINGDFEFMVDFAEKCKARNLTFKYVVTNIDLRLEDNQLFYVYTIQGMVSGRAKNGEYKSLHSKPIKCLGVSSDKGRSWKFLDYNNATPNILRKKQVNETIINKIMAY